MEKFDNMKQNMIADDELDQISGGKGLFDVFTAEFRGKAEKANTLRFDPEDEKNDFTVSTLDMRTNPLDQKTENKNRKTIKL